MEQENYFEIPTFLPMKQGKSRMEKFKVVMLDLSEICLFVFFFSFEVPCSKFKMASISK